MAPTPIEQLKREALAGIRHHPDDLKAASAATLAKHLPTIKAVQAAAARVLANVYPQTSSQSLQVDAHAWECFKAELDKVDNPGPSADYWEARAEDYERNLG